MVGGYTALSRREKHQEIETSTLLELSNNEFFAEETNIPFTHETHRRLLSTTTSALPVSAQYPAIFELGNLKGLNGFKLDGETINDRSGNSVSTAGDINGDGCADIIIGSHMYNYGVGRSYKEQYLC
jgi:hypothetical protein